MARVLVLGGGSGGLVVAHQLARHLKDTDHQVILINRSANHVFMPSLPWVATGLKEPEEVQRPLRLLERQGAHVIQGQVQEVDTAHRRVKVDHETIPYDFLVVSLGAQMRPDLLPGSEAVYFLWTLEGALKIREALRRFSGGRIVVGLAGTYHRLSPAPFELAGLVEFALQARGLRSRSELVMIHPLPQPLSWMGPAVSEAVADILARKGIRYEGNFNLQAIDPEGRRLIAADGREILFDLAILLPPCRPPALAFHPDTAARDGTVLVDPATFRSIADPSVFIIGDMVNPSLHLPPAGVVAHLQAEFVADQILAESKARMLVVASIRWPFSWSISGMTL